MDDTGMQNSQQSKTITPSDLPSFATPSNTPSIDVNMEKNFEKNVTEHSKMAD